MKPALIVVGGNDPAAIRSVASLYATGGVEPCLTTLRTAEMIKYACNAFHAVKITSPMRSVRSRRRCKLRLRRFWIRCAAIAKLNISAAYLKPGFAFGGSCLPKDLRAMRYRAARLDLKLPMLESILPSNEEHLRRAIEARSIWARFGWAWSVSRLKRTQTTCAKVR